MEPLLLLVAWYLTYPYICLGLGVWIPQPSISEKVWTFYNILESTNVASPICMNNGVWRVLMQKSEIEFFLQRIAMHILYRVYLLYYITSRWDPLKRNILSWFHSKICSSQSNWLELWFPFCILCMNNLLTKFCNYPYTSLR